MPVVEPDAERSPYRASRLHGLLMYRAPRPATLGSGPGHRDRAGKVLARARTVGRGPAAGQFSYEKYSRRMPDE
jgi:hypothetical protein